MDKEDLIPGQVSCSDAEEDSDGSESPVNKLEWTMKNPHLSGVEDVESLASSSESVDMSKDDELEPDDSLIISEELALEQSNIADICDDDDDDGPKKNNDDDLEDVIELDRPPSPNKGVIYPSPPQYAPPSQEFQQQQLQYQQQQQQYQQQQYQAQIGMPQPLAPVSSMQVANQMVCYPPQPTGFLLPPQQVRFGPKSTQVTCSNCQQHVNTKTSRNVNTSGWICTCLFCIFCCPLSWVPVVCIDNCQDTVHKCSNCGMILGKHNA